MTIKCFTKNAVGYNSYFDRENFDFKSEKEWRFVPTKAEIDNNLISRNKKQYDKNPNLYNDKLKKFPLKFSIMDIRYLFVETEEQRSEVSKEFKINKNIIKISRWTTRLKKAEAIKNNGL